MATKKKQAPRKLCRVKEGFYLHWPASIKNRASSTGSGRGGPGYVVDLNLPLERDWCKGQMHKLEAIAAKDSKGVEVSSIDDVPAARNARAFALAEGPPEPEPEPVVEATKRTAEAKADVVADAPMEPDAPAAPSAPEVQS